MVEFLTIVAIAAGYQLAVLPGEKVQFIIAALSTRYSPWLVVAAAGSAFGLWTAVELLVGQALLETLPGGVLDLITGGLFLFFGVLLLRSAPDEGGSLGAMDATEDDGASTDGGVFALDENLDVSIFGWTVPERYGAFFPIFAMMAAGEFGDKTQIVTIGLAVQYGAHPGIWIGEMLAIVPVSIANAMLFYRFSHLLNMRKAHIASAALFFFFGGDTILALTTGYSVWEQLVSAVGSFVGPIWASVIGTTAFVGGLGSAAVGLV